MGDVVSSLLTYPFEKGVLDWPQASQKVLLWGAQYFPKFKDIGQVQLAQSFKPYADIWAANGVESVLHPPSQARYSFVFCSLPQQKDAALARLAGALNRLEEGGLLLCVAPNDAGGGRLENWVQKFGLKPQSLSKKKCRIVWARKENADQHRIDELIQGGVIGKLNFGAQDFITKAGIFGWNKIDKGSALLVDSLPKDLGGNGADFGCGYGYLSDALLKNGVDVKKLYAIDADAGALECAKGNLQCYEDTVDIEYCWEDLNHRPKGLSPLDWVVMNPPFHEGKGACSSIGQAFIEVAVASMRKGGTLYMVANAHLPYEKTLRPLFSKVEKVVEQQGFKVFHAVK